MKADIAALSYLASGVLFILALRGLSSPETSRGGNIRGMTGMALAIVTTLWVTGVTDALTWGLIIAGVAIGGGIGAVIARRIHMTQMPQLVAAFHSLVGLAAVLVAVPMPCRSITSNGRKPLTILLGTSPAPMSNVVAAP